MGADVVALVVDPPDRNAAMAARWHLTFPIHSDPDGAQFLKPLDLWHADERDGIAWPAALVFDPAGAEMHRFRCRDFADRPPDDAELFAVLRSLDIPALKSPAPWHHGVEPVEDPGALRTDAFRPYFRGIRFATRGLAGRLTDPADRTEALQMSEMAMSFLDAWKQRREVGRRERPTTPH